MTLREHVRAKSCIVYCAACIMHFLELGGSAAKVSMKVNLYGLIHLRSVFKVVLWVFEQNIYIYLTVHLSLRGLHHAFFRIGRFSRKSSMKVFAVFPRKVPTSKLKVELVQLWSTLLGFIYIVLSDKARSPSHVKRYKMNDPMFTESMMRNSFSFFAFILEMHDKVCKERLHLKSLVYIINK